MLLLVQGRKSSKEKFAGSLFTTTVEAFVPTNGRGIQVGPATTAYLLSSNQDNNNHKMGHSRHYTNSAIIVITTVTTSIRHVLYAESNTCVSLCHAVVSYESPALNPV